MFPGNAAGAALLILRVGTITLIAACSYVHSRFTSLGWSEVAIAILIVLIGIGLLTPIACGLAAILEVFFFLESHGADAGHAVPEILVTVALGLLGPGAWSLDGRLFGRRRLVVPEGTGAPRSPEGREE